MVPADAQWKFTIKTLGELPWPGGLGKSEYYRLELRMKWLLGDRYANPDAHREAMASNPDYRLIVSEELRDERWAGRLLEVATEATVLARSAPLLNQPLPHQGDWLAWTYPYRDTHGYPIYAWLSGAPKVEGGKLTDGRHRLTYLRLLADPDFEVLV